jgi:hypothetical protein
MKTFTGGGMVSPYDSSDLTNYPKGDYLNASSPGAGDGTPVTKANINDFYQVFVELLRLASITPNEADEKKGSSQVVTALQTLFLELTNVVKIPIAFGVVSNSLTLTVSEGITPTIQQGIGDTSTLREIELDFGSAADYVLQVWTLGTDANRLIHARHNATTGVYDNYVYIRDVDGNAVTDQRFAYMLYKKTGKY